MAIDFDSELISKNFTIALLQQCESIESQLIEAGMDNKFTRLITIQSAYNSFKQLLSKINDVETQTELFKLFENDAKNLVFVKLPNVDSVGHA